MQINRRDRQADKKRDRMRHRGVTHRKRENAIVAYSELEIVCACVCVRKIYFWCEIVCV